MRSFNLFFIFAVLIIPRYGLSQDSLLNKSKPNIVSTKAIKFSPFHLINFYPSVQFAFEKGLTSTSSIQIDLGYVFNYGNVSDEFIDKRGIKAKLEYRHFLLKSSGKNLTYISVEPYLNAVNFDRNETIVNCFDLDCTMQFSQRSKYLVRYRETGLSGKFGFIAHVSDRIIVDINYGLMIRIVDYKKENQVDEIQWNGFFQIPNENKRIGIGPVLGLRVGYKFM